MPVPNLARATLEALPGSFCAPVGTKMSFAESLKILNCQLHMSGRQGLRRIRGEEIDDSFCELPGDDASILGVSQLVRQECSQPGTVEKAVVSKSLVVGRSELELSDAMCPSVCVDPEEQIVRSANAKCDLILRRTRKCSVDYINRAQNHRTP